MGEKKKSHPSLSLQRPLMLMTIRMALKAVKKKTITIIYAIKTSKNFKREFQKR